jgi:hypothetical protein
MRQREGSNRQDLNLAAQSGFHFAQIGGIRAGCGDGWLEIFQAHWRAAALPVAIMSVEQG